MQTEILRKKIALRFQYNKRQERHKKIKRFDAERHLLLINFLFTFLFVIFIDCLSHFLPCIFDLRHQVIIAQYAGSSRADIDLKANCRRRVGFAISDDIEETFKANQMKPRQQQVGKIPRLSLDWKLHVTEPVSGVSIAKMEKASEDWNLIDMDW